MVLSVVGRRVEDGDELGDSRCFTREMKESGNVHACAMRIRMSSSFQPASVPTRLTLAAAVDLLDGAEANARQVVALPCNH